MMQIRSSVVRRVLIGLFLVVALPGGAQTVVRTLSTATAGHNIASVRCSGMVEGDEHPLNTAVRSRQRSNDIVFATHVISNSIGGGQYAYAIDLDRDGDVDILTAASDYEASENRDDITWWENDGGGSFTAHVVASDFDAAMDVYGIDLDDDGDIDILGAAREVNSIAWWENDGSETFTAHTISGSFAGAHSVYAIDLDSDGDKDVLGAAMSAGSIAWWENDGSESFTPHTISGSFADARHVYATDIDRDGDVDVLGAARSANDITWWENDGTESFAEHTIDGNFSGAMHVHAADLDGDGDIDVLGAARFGGEISWWENDGSQSFGEHTIANDLVDPYGVYATDVDGDGDMDVLGASRNRAEVAWWENSGSGAFSKHVLANDFTGSLRVHAADFDTDGDQDILAISYGDLLAWWENTMPHQMVSFGSARSLTSNAAGHKTVHAADVDGDGDLDILSASSPNDNVDEKIAWYENSSGDGSAWAGRIIYSGNQNDSSVYAADLDSDGDLDVLSTSIDDDRVSWYENDGASPPSFAHRVIATTANAISVHAADIDNDGDVDVLSASCGNDRVAWYENDGASPPGFTSHIIVTDADDVRWVYSADVDGDGDIDVLSASPGDDKIAWYENDGASSPTFTPHIVTTTADGARSVHAGDVDSDGDLDILSLSQVDDEVTWYENDGALLPVFAPHIVTTDADGVVSVYAADMDNDGDLDILSSSDEGLIPTGEIIWYENDGSPTPVFTTHVIATGVLGAKNVYAADVDGDGDKDVIAGSTGDDIAWWENAGGGAVYVPLVLGDYVPYFKGPWEQEDNDSHTQANGPLISGSNYYGYPDDGKDYFSVQMPTNGTITVNLDNHTGQGVQLFLFYQSPANEVGWDYQAPYDLSYTGPAGWYYVYIYTESGFNATTPYTLRVTYP
jgi:hypothetical protein